MVSWPCIVGLPIRACWFSIANCQFTRGYNNRPGWSACESSRGQSQRLIPPVFMRGTNESCKTLADPMYLDQLSDSPNPPGCWINNRLLPSIDSRENLHPIVVRETPRDWRITDRNNIKEWSNKSARLSEHVGVSNLWEYYNLWMLYFMEKTHKKWIIWGFPHDLGNPLGDDDRPSCATQLRTKGNRASMERSRWSWLTHWMRHR